MVARSYGAGHVPSKKGAFRFKTFAERIGDVDLDPIRPSHDFPSSDGLTDAASLWKVTHFSERLEYWITTNLSNEFTELSRELAPFCTCLPMILNNIDTIVKLLITHLAQATRVSTEPILNLIGILSRDLRQELEPLLPKIFEALMNKLDASDTHILEHLFKCLSYIFRFLSVTIAHNFSFYIDLYAKWLSHRLPHIRQFAAESFAFVLKRCPLERVHAGLEALSVSLTTDLSVVEASALCESIGVLIFESIKNIHDNFTPRLELVCHYLLNAVVLRKSVLYTSSHYKTPVISEDSYHKQLSAVRTFFQCARHHCATYQSKGFERLSQIFLQFFSLVVQRLGRTPSAEQERHCGTDIDVPDGKQAKADTREVAFCTDLSRGWIWWSPRLRGSADSFFQATVMLLLRAYHSCVKLRITEQSGGVLHTWAAENPPASIIQDENIKSVLQAIGAIWRGLPTSSVTVQEEHNIPIFDSLLLQDEKAMATSRFSSSAVVEPTLSLIHMLLQPVRVEAPVGLLETPILKLIFHFINTSDSEDSEGTLGYFAALSTSLSSIPVTTLQTILSELDAKSSSCYRATFFPAVCRLIKAASGVALTSLGTNCITITRISSIFKFVSRALSLLMSSFSNWASEIPSALLELEKLNGLQWGMYWRIWSVVEQDTSGRYCASSVLVFSSSCCLLLHAIVRKLQNSQGNPQRYTALKGEDYPRIMVDKLRGALEVEPLRESHSVAVFDSLSNVIECLNVLHTSLASCAYKDTSGLTPERIIQCSAFTFVRKTYGSKLAVSCVDLLKIRHDEDDMPDSEKRACKPLIATGSCSVDLAWTNAAVGRALSALNSDIVAVRISALRFLGLFVFSLSDASTEPHMMALVANLMDVLFELEISPNSLQTERYKLQLVERIGCYAVQLFEGQTNGNLEFVILHAVCTVLLKQFKTKFAPLWGAAEAAFVQLFRCWTRANICTTSRAAMICALEFRFWDQLHSGLSISPATGDKALNVEGETEDVGFPDIIVPEQVVNGAKRKFKQTSDRGVRRKTATFVVDLRKENRVSRHPALQNENTGRVPPTGYCFSLPQPAVLREFGEIQESICAEEDKWFESSLTDSATHHQSLCRLAVKLLTCYQLEGKWNCCFLTTCSWFLRKSISAANVLAGGVESATYSTSESDSFSTQCRWESRCGRGTQHKLQEDIDCEGARNFWVEKTLEGRSKQNMALPLQGDVSIIAQARDFLYVAAALMQDRHRLWTRAPRCYNAEQNQKPLTEKECIELELRPLFTELISICSTSLLLIPSVKIQELALKIATFGATQLNPYSAELQLLINESASVADQMLKFSLDSSKGIIGAQHRSVVIPFVIRILFSKLSRRRGGEKGAYSRVSRENIFGFFSALPQSELTLLLSIMTSPFIRCVVPEGESHFQGGEVLKEKSFRQIIDGSPHLFRIVEEGQYGGVWNLNDMQFRMAVSEDSVRMILGFLSASGALLKYVGRCLSLTHARFLVQLYSSTLGLCRSQKSSRLLDVETDSSTIHSAASTSPGQEVSVSSRRKDIVRQSLSLLTQLIEIFPDMDWESELQKVAPLLHRLLEDAVKFPTGATSVIGKMVKLWSSDVRFFPLFERLLPSALPLLFALPRSTATLSTVGQGTPGITPVLDLAIRIGQGGADNLADEKALKKTEMKKYLQAFREKKQRVNDGSTDEEDDTPEKMPLAIEAQNAVARGKAVLTPHIGVLLESLEIVVNARKNYAPSKRVEGTKEVAHISIKELEVLILTAKFCQEPKTACRLLNLLLHSMPSKLTAATESSANRFRLTFGAMQELIDLIAPLVLEEKSVGSSAAPCPATAVLQALLIKIYDLYQTVRDLACRTKLGGTHLAAAAALARVEKPLEFLETRIKFNRTYKLPESNLDEALCLWGGRGPADDVTAEMLACLSAETCTTWQLIMATLCFELNRLAVGRGIGEPDIDQHLTLLFGLTNGKHIHHEGEGTENIRIPAAYLNCLFGHCLFLMGSPTIDVALRHAAVKVSCAIVERLRSMCLLPESRTSGQNGTLPPTDPSVEASSRAHINSEKSILVQLITGRAIPHIRRVIKHHAQSLVAANLEFFAFLIGNLAPLHKYLSDSGPMEKTAEVPQFSVEEGKEANRDMITNRGTLRQYFAQLHLDLYPFMAVEKSGDKHDIGTFSFEGGSLFGELLHLQKHRRGRGLLLLGKAASEKKLTTSTLTKICIPLSISNVLQHGAIGDAFSATLAESAITCLASCCANISWSACLTTVLRLFKLCGEAEERKTVLLKAICSILTSFRYHLEDAVQQFVQSSISDGGLVAPTEFSASNAENRIIPSTHAIGLSDKVHEAVKKAKQLYQQRIKANSAESSNPQHTTEPARPAELPANLEDPEQDELGLISPNLGETQNLPDRVEEEEREELSKETQEELLAAKNVASNRIRAIQHSIRFRVIPMLRKYMLGKSRSEVNEGKKPEMGAIRPEVLSVLLQVMRYLPAEDFHLELPKTIRTLSMCLVSRDWGLRKKASKAFSRVVRALGPVYLSWLLSEVSTQMVKGFQISVLATVVQTSLSELQTENDNVQLNIRTACYDECCAFVTQLIVKELEQKVDTERAVETAEDDAFCKKIPESKAFRGPELMYMMAKQCSVSSCSTVLFAFIYNLLSGRSHSRVSFNNSTAYGPKYLNRVKEIANKFVAGICHNAHFSAAQLLSFAERFLTLSTAVETCLCAGCGQVVWLDDSNVPWQHAKKRGGLRLHCGKVNEGHRPDKGLAKARDVSVAVLSNKSTAVTGEKAGVKGGASSEFSQRLQCSVCETNSEQIVQTRAQRREDYMKVQPGAPTGRSLNQAIKHIAGFDVAVQGFVLGRAGLMLLHKTLSLSEARDLIDRANDGDGFEDCVNKEQSLKAQPLSRRQIFHIAIDKPQSIEQEKTLSANLVAKVVACFVGRNDQLFISSCKCLTMFHGLNRTALSPVARKVAVTIMKVLSLINCNGGAAKSLVAMVPLCTKLLATFLVRDKTAEKWFGGAMEADEIEEAGLNVYFGKNGGGAFGDNAQEEDTAADAISKSGKEKVMNVTFRSALLSHIRSSLDNPKLCSSSLHLFKKLIFYDCAVVLSSAELAQEVYAAVDELAKLVVTQAAYDRQFSLTAAEIYVDFLVMYPMPVDIQQIRVAFLVKNLQYDSIESKRRILCTLNALVNRFDANLLVSRYSTLLFVGVPVMMGECDDPLTRWMTSLFIARLLKKMDKDTSRRALLAQAIKAMLAKSVSQRRAMILTLEGLLSFYKKSILTHCPIIFNLLFITLYYSNSEDLEFDTVLNYLVDQLQQIYTPVDGTLCKQVLTRLKASQVEISSDKRTIQLATETFGLLGSLLAELSWADLQPLHLKVAMSRNEPTEQIMSRKKHSAVQRDSDLTTRVSEVEALQSVWLFAIHKGIEHFSVEIKKKCVEILLHYTQLEQTAQQDCLTVSLLNLRGPSQGEGEKARHVVLRQILAFFSTDSFIEGDTSLVDILIKCVVGLIHSCCREDAGSCGERNLPAKSSKKTDESPLKTQIFDQKEMRSGTEALVCSKPNDRLLADTVDSELDADCDTPLGGGFDKKSENYEGGDNCCQILGLFDHASKMHIPQETSEIAKYVPPQQNLKSDYLQDLTSMIEAFGFTSDPKNGEVIRMGTSSSSPKVKGPNATNKLNKKKHWGGEASFVRVTEEDAFAQQTGVLEVAKTITTAIRIGLGKLPSHIYRVSASISLLNILVTELPTASCSPAVLSHFLDAIYRCATLNDNGVQMSTSFWNSVNESRKEEFDAVSLLSPKEQVAYVKYLASSVLRSMEKRFPSHASNLATTRQRLLQLRSARKVAIKRRLIAEPDKAALRIIRKNMKKRHSRKLKVARLRVKAGKPVQRSLLKE